MLRRSLAGLVPSGAFEAAEVRPDSRAENLDVYAWGRLAAAVAAATGPGVIPVGRDAGPASRRVHRPGRPPSRPRPSTPPAPRTLGRSRTLADVPDVAVTAGRARCGVPADCVRL